MYYAFLVMRIDTYSRGQTFLFNKLWSGEGKTHCTGGAYEQSVTSADKTDL